MRIIPDFIDCDGERIWNRDAEFAIVAEIGEKCTFCSLICCSEGCCIVRIVCGTCFVGVFLTARTVKVDILQHILRQDELRNGRSIVGCCFLGCDVLICQVC